MAFASNHGSAPWGVLMMSWIFSPLIRSTILGRPSLTLKTRSTVRPERSSVSAVPWVATRVKPRSTKRRATSAICDLSWSATLMKTMPLVGRVWPAASWALAKASPKLSAVPMTSPVDFISGPRTVSTPGNLFQGKTGDLT